MKLAYIHLIPLVCLNLSLKAQQCPPPGFPQPGFSCNTAPIICQGIDGYCSTLADTSMESYFYGCANGSTVLNNDEWVAFVAGSTTIGLEIAPSNCQFTGNNMGIQAALYKGCPNTAQIMDVQCDCSTDPFVLSADNFVVGETYWLVVDGCAGDVCDYSIHVLTGSTVAPLPAAPGPIFGIDTVCSGTSSLYETSLLTGVTVYSWELLPINAGNIAINNQNQIEVAWNNSFHGAAQLCLRTKNACVSNPDTVCKTIQVYSTPNSFISGSENICVGYSSTVDLNVVFTGGGPWGFTPMFNGIPQTPLVANTSPYTLTVSEPGNWTINGVYQTEGLCVGSSTGVAIVGTDTVNMITNTFCPGETVYIGGQAYTQPGVVRYIIPGSTSCNGVFDFTLVQLPQPEKRDTVFLCPGESVVLNGQTYTQPGVVSWTIPGAPCDTLVTYSLLHPFPSASILHLQCPPDIYVADAPAHMPIQYAQPTASSDCVCTDISLDMSAGLPSGATFPLGTTLVCYQAADVCGQTANCCFEVRLEQSAQPCDVKQNGCMRYELLSIEADAEGNQTYRIRVQNNCSNPLIYTAIQLPDGTVATAPPDMSVYTSPESFAFAVRNPNFTPFYSMRFKSVGDSLANGQSATLEYTLPAQLDPDYIHVSSRLAPQIFLEAHLNTFNCPVMGATKQRAAPKSAGAGLHLYPNPSAGQLWVEVADWPTLPLSWRLFNSQGQRLPYTLLQDLTSRWELNVPQDLPNGLYFLEMTDMNGEKVILSWFLMR